MTVGQLLASVSSYELTEWKVYYKIKQEQEDVQQQPEKIPRYELGQHAVPGGDGILSQLLFGEGGE
jgi:hypothetical protein